jgi:hypothetical protein
MFRKQSSGVSSMDDKGAGPRQTASVEQRVAAIEAAFEARGMEPKPFIESMTHVAEEEWVPRNGARIVAKAWTGGPTPSSVSASLPTANRPRRSLA